MKSFKEIKVELIKERKDNRQIALSFNDGRYGVDVKWITQSEALGILEALKGILKEQ